MRGEIESLVAELTDAARVELAKVGNPNHDEHGRFSAGEGGGPGGLPGVSAETAHTYQQHDAAASYHALRAAKATGKVKIAHETAAAHHKAASDHIASGGKRASISENARQASKVAHGM